MEQNISVQEYYKIILYLHHLKKYISCFSGTAPVYQWKSNGISGEFIENITKSDRNFAPNFVNHLMIEDINFNEHCLINDNIYILTKVINLYISYILNPQLKNLNTDLALNNLFFGYGRILRILIQINIFTQSGNRFVLSLQYNRSKSFLFVIATKKYQLKAKDSKIKDYILCLSNI